MAETVTVLVGTTKGAFLLDSDANRTDWTVRGPMCDGWPVNHIIGDPNSGQIWAAAGGEWHGAGIWRSKDHGETWELALLSNGMMDEMLANDENMRKMFGRGPGPDAPFKGQINTFWVVSKVGETLYAGSKPAALFASTDKGETWERVKGLSTHPSAAEWQAGGAGLVLHTILGEGENLWVGISAAGVFASEDGGKTWDHRNRRTNQASEPDPITGECGHDVGLCVHNMVRTSRPGLMYQQNHRGVYRSRDDGRSWHEISEGLPSNFGFPVSAHPHDPETLWVLPLSEHGGRTPPDGKATVWRSRDSGDSWQAMRNGLPDNCFFTVLRQAMATDRAKQAGVYFGTNTGSVFASLDDGETWSEIARHLPTILGVEVMHQP